MRLAAKSIPPGPMNFNCSSDDEPFESGTKYPKIRKNDFNCAKNLPGNFRDIYDIKDLQNQGRYYIAKIVEPPGKVVARLLVDKLNGTVHFPKNSLKS